ncbi:MAG: general secretion pathway protein GspK [Maricaulaceae bacterium]
MRAHQGFILPIVLGVISAMALVFALGARTTARVQRAAIPLNDRALAEAAILSAEETLIFYVLAGGANPGGVDLTRTINERTPEPDAVPIPLRFDGRPYAADWTGAPVRASVRDRGGLINLRWASEAVLRDLAGALGAPAADQPSLGAILADFIDETDTPRPGGAETAAYARAGRPPPPSRSLTVIDEARGALGWDREAFWRPGGLTDLAVVSGARRLNLNAAPPAVLRVLAPGGRSEDLARFYAQRRLSAFADLSEALNVLGTPLRADVTPTTDTTRRVRVESWRLGDGVRRRIDIDVDYSDTIAPARVRDRRLAPASTDVLEAWADDDLPSLPDPARGFPLSPGRF